MTELFSTPAVVLEGSPRGNLGIVRTLGRLGVPMYVVQSKRSSPASQSRFCTGTFEWDFAAANAEETVTFLAGVGQRIGRRSFLFPTCDETAILAAAHFETLREWFIYPQQTPSLASALVSKKEMYFLAKRHGVPTPQASFPQSINDVLRFSESAKFPMMVKGIDGARLKRTLGAGVIIANSRSDLIDLYQCIEESERSNLMLQEYIPGGDDTIWMFNGYFDSNSNCLFGITGKKIRQYPPYTGQTSLGVCLRNHVIHETTAGWMKALGYKGILDIGYRYDARDGKYKVLDVNPRIGATFRLFVDRLGMDVARAMYLNLSRQPVPYAVSREGRRWIVEDADIGSSLRYRKDKKLTFAQWLKSLPGIEEAAYFAFDDMRPFWDMCMRSLRRRTQGLSLLKRKPSPGGSPRSFAGEARLLSGAVAREQ
jgi:D-aspartate ligase